MIRTSAGNMMTWNDWYISGMPHRDARYLVVDVFCFVLLPRFDAQEFHIICLRCWKQRFVGRGFGKKGQQLTDS